jgi:hypothetical protein
MPPEPSMDAKVFCGPPTSETMIPPLCLVCPRKRKRVGFVSFGIAGKGGARHVLSRG